MIIEFALAATLSLPQPSPPLIDVEFNEPVQQVLTYPPAGELVRLSGLELPSGTREAFEDDFSVDPLFFGAFAITKDFGYGYVTGTNSMEAARDIAMQECLKQGDRCLIYAEIRPLGYEPLEQGQVSMAPEAAGYYNNPEASWGNFRAMAISEDGAYSVVWNYGSPAEAAAAALEDCNEYVLDDLPELRDMSCVLVPFK